MQYIQLQGQVAADLDLPIAGGYNLFIDTSDNTIKAKDNDGHIHSSGNSLVTMTKTELDTAITDGNLAPGVFYKITGVASGSSDRTIQEGGTTIILQAATTSSLNPKGVGLFWNPNYYDPNTDLGNYDVWNPTFEFQLDRYYNDVSFDMEEQLNLDAPCNVTLRPNILDNTAIVTLNNNADASYFTGDVYPILFNGDNTGITGSFISLQNGPTTFIEGNKVIWGGRVWQNLNGNLGDSNGQFELDNTEWQVVPYNSNDYDLVANIIEYDYQHNNICYRKDTINNIEVFANWWEMDGSDNYIKAFSWGHPNIHNVSLENTYTDNLVNFPTYNHIDGLYMKSNTRFGANYWGKYNNFYDVIGETNSRISNLSLGKWATFRRWQLGINSNIGGNGTMYIVGNDGSTITDITLGTNSNIFGMEMYQYSYLDNIIMGDDADIYGMNMHSDTRIQNIDMGLRTGLNSISFGNGSYLSNTNLDANSYIANINLDVNAEIYNISLGRNSYMEFNSLGINSSLYDISMGVDSSIFCNTLYNTSNLSSTINNISFGDNSGGGGIELHGGTYISNINTSNGVGFNALTITGSNSYLANFEMEQNSGFGGFTIDGSQGSAVSFDNFKIGQDSGFGGIGIVTSSLSNITIERGFTNMWNTQIQDVNGSTDSSDRTYINIDNRNIVTIDISGVSGTQNWSLPDGQYEGHEITFVVKTDGTHTIAPDQINVWTNNILVTGYGYGIQKVLGGGSYLGIRPFAKLDNNLSATIWKNMTKAVWTGGIWVTDAEVYND